MNVDGLAGAVGLDVWHFAFNPTGKSMLAEGRHMQCRGLQPRTTVTGHWEAALDRSWLAAGPCLLHANVCIQCAAKSTHVMV